MLNGVSVTTYPTTVRWKGGTDWAARMLNGVSPVSGILWRRLERKPRLAQVQWGGGGLYHDAIQQFFGVTLEEMYGLFFGSRIKCPDTTEDAGLNCNRPDTHVSNSVAEHAIFLFVITSF